MKNEMPPSTTSAPIAMMMAELPVKALPLPAVLVVEIVGTAVVVVGIDTLGCGNPGDRGLLPDCSGVTGVLLVVCASAGDGSAIAAPISTAR
jgi:hypothetical protein